MNGQGSPANPSTASKASGDVRSRLFGTIAVRAGLATQEQVDECLSIQDNARTQGLLAPRLGDLMAMKGYVSREHVAGILRGDFSEQGTRFGEICVRMRFATETQVRDCLLEQEIVRQKGETRRIGRILVERGLLRPLQVSAVLGAQGVEIAACTACGKRFNIQVTAADDELVCPGCTGRLEPQQDYDACSATAVSDDILPTTDEHVSSLDLEPLVESSEWEPFDAEDFDAEKPSPIPERMSAAETRVNEIPAAPGDIEDIEELPEEEEAPVYGDYRVMQKIGADALGVVYQAEHVPTGELAALKVIECERMREKQFLDEFVERMTKSATLSHPALKRIVAAGRSGGKLYYASEFIRGRSARVAVETHGPLSLSAANRVLRDIAGALSYVHHRGIFHGDIRPSLIILTPDGQVKLADAGVPKNVAGNVKRLAQMIGVTPFYMAPELAADGTEPDARSDIYELGATYYHLVSGRPPFEGDTPLEIFMRMAEEDAVPLDVLKPEIPRVVSDMISRMMAPEPADRYQSMEEVIAELEQIIGPDTSAHAPVGIEGPPRELVFSDDEASPESVPAKPAKPAQPRKSRPKRAHGVKPSARARPTGSGKMKTKHKQTAHAPASGSGQVAMGVFLALVVAAAVVMLAKMIGF